MAFLEKVSQTAVVVDSSILSGRVANGCGNGLEVNVEGKFGKQMCYRHRVFQR